MPKSRNALSKIILVVLVCLLSFQSFPAATAQAQDNTLRVSFADLGYGDLNLKGLFSEKTVWFPFDYNWQIESDAQVTINYVASQVVLEDNATITILVNGIHVTSFRPEADELEHQFSFDVPARFLDGNGLLLSAQALLYVDDDECQEDNNPGQWINILDTSQIALTPNVDNSAPRLQDMSQELIMTSVVNDLPPVIFVLPENPDQTTLDVAANISARLGETASVMTMDVRTLAELSPAEMRQANFIMVGVQSEFDWPQELTQAFTASFTNDQFVSADGQAVPATDGVVQIFISPWNAQRNILLVSGGSSEALAKAGSVFSSTTNTQLLRGEYVFVNSTVEALEPLNPQPWTTDETTFRDLGQEISTIQGTGVNDQYYRFRYPTGWVFETGTRLNLHISSSPSLNKDFSYVDVFINGNYIGTIETGTEKTDQTVSFDLPVDELNYPSDGQRERVLEVRLSVANTPEKDQCERIDPTLVWTKILDDSSFITTHSYTELPDLQVFPYPFISDQTRIPTAIIIPANPTSMELSQGLEVANTLGHLAVDDPIIHMYSADQVTEDILASHHLIMVGVEDRNTILADGLSQIDPIPELSFYQAVTNEALGILYEVASPWNEKNVALFIYAKANPGVSNAITVLHQSEPPVNQPGSVAVVDDELEPQIIYRDDGL